MNRPIPVTQDEETASDRDRIAREARGLAEARAELAAGLFVSEADVDAWIKSLATPRELPPPSPRR